MIELANARLVKISYKIFDIKYTIKYTCVKMCLLLKKVSQLIFINKD